MAKQSFEDMGMTKQELGHEGLKERRASSRRPPTREAPSLSRVRTPLRAPPPAEGTEEKNEENAADDAQ